MKRRTGLVSNSSSSSYVIVGLHHPRRGNDDGNPFHEVVAALGIDEENLNEWFDKHTRDEIGYGCWNIDGLGVWASWGDEEIYYVGLDGETFLLEDMRLSEIKKLAAKQIKKVTGINVDLEYIEMDITEVSSE